MVDKRMRMAIEIETIYELIDELDYYQLLGLRQESQQAEVEPGFREQSRRLHPDRVKKQGDKELSRKATAIYRAVNEAYRTLKDPETRSAYDGELATGNLRLSDGGRADAAAATDASNDPSSAARTEKGAKYWRMAQQNWRDEDYKGCVMNIKFALNFEKDNDTFKDWLDKAEKAAKAKDAKTQKNPYKLRFY